MPHRQLQQSPHQSQKLIQQSKRSHRKYLNKLQIQSKQTNKKEKEEEETTLTNRNIKEIEIKLRVKCCVSV